MPHSRFRGLCIVFLPIKSHLALMLAALSLLTGQPQCLAAENPRVSDLFLISREWNPQTTVPQLLELLRTWSLPSPTPTMTPSPHPTLTPRMTSTPMPTLPPTLAEDFIPLSLGFWRKYRMESRTQYETDVYTIYRENQQYQSFDGYDCLVWKSYYLSGADSNPMFSAGSWKSDGFYLFRHWGNNVDGGRYEVIYTQHELYFPQNVVVGSRTTRDYTKKYYLNSKLQSTTQGTTTISVLAYPVTKTVSAGTFRDCVKLHITDSYTLKTSSGSYSGSIDTYEWHAQGVGLVFLELTIEQTGAVTVEELLAYGEN
jgi:hypothetical protein